MRNTIPQGGSPRRPASPARTSPERRAPTAAPEEATAPRASATAAAGASRTPASPLSGERPTAGSQDARSPIPTTGPIDPGFPIPTTGSIDPRYPIPTTGPIEPGYPMPPPLQPIRPADMPPPLLPIRNPAGSHPHPRNDRPESSRAGSQTPPARPAPANDPIITEFVMKGQRGWRSLFNGFKPMSPHVQDAIRQTEQLFPQNTYDVRNPHNQNERAVVFHDRGQDKLVPGPINVGTAGEVQAPKDIADGTARVNVHTHPFTGRRTTYEPSMNDQAVARFYPDVEHIVQAPSLRGESQYYIFSGATPARHYRLLPNPDNLPVPPDSPDRGMPAFRQRPATGDQEGIPFSEHPGNV
jgi:hypothetical protein